MSTSYERLPTSEHGSPPPSPSFVRRNSTLSTALYMVLWIASSNFTIVFNKWLIDTVGFEYPILLTCWHLTFAAIVTQALAHTTKLLDSRHELPINRSFYLKTILPIGIASSGSLVCSNVVYLYLSVPFIQMLKAASPVVVLFFSWLMGLTNPTIGTIGNILVIVSSVALASFGEIAFSWVGAAYQMAGLTFEALRVVLIQVMLSGEGLQMDPIVGLYYYAPVCAALNFLVALAIEVPKFAWADLEKAGYMVLLLNAAVAFGLNLVSMALIGKTSGLVSTLTGIFKNLLLVVCSAIFWKSHIAPLQIIGYTISLLGLIYYSFGAQKLYNAAATAVLWVAGLLGLYTETEKGRRVRGWRIGILIGAVTLLSVASAVVYMRGIDASFAWLGSSPTGTGTQRAE